MRALSTSALTSLAAQETDAVWLELLTISHADLATPIRIVNDTGDIVSRGSVFTGFPFRIDLPVDHAEEVPAVTLVIDNVDRSITDALQALKGPPLVTLEIIMAATPDVVEMSLPEMELREASFDAFIVTGTLSFEPVLDVSFPGYAYTPQDYPGLF